MVTFSAFLGSVIGLVDEFITAQIVIQRLTEVIDATPEALRHQAGEHLDFLDSVDPFTNGLVPKPSNSNGKFSTIIN